MTTVPPYSNRGAQNTNSNGLRACVDWLQVTFLDISNPFDIVTLLGMENSDFEDKSTGKFGYASHIRCNNIAIYFGTQDHVHLEITGQGCRQYEAKKIHDWTALIGLFLMLRVNITRLDLAIDDFLGYFKVPTLYQKFRKGHAKSIFKDYRYMTSGKIADRGVTGNTLYVGSPTSRLMVRFYDKYLERTSKGYQLEDGITCWNRTELQLRDERASTAAMMIASEDFNIGELISGILKNYINFLNPKRNKDGSIDKNKSRWPVSDFWLKFLGDIAPIKLSQAAPDKTIETTFNWFENSITPSMAALMEAFDYDVELLNHWIIEGKDRLTGRHKDMICDFKLKQMSLDDILKIKKDQNPNSNSDLV